ncbi:restriction endonuclease subunit S [Yersinia alsatica]|uniref:restriction endonuclease subunit S n=1 Tax=Yersinia alsatica TaxID=2890317 RepID=UPI0032EFC53C
MISKVYSSYKESGSLWLGQIPSHWSVKKLKFLAVVQPSNVDKKTIDGEEPVLLCNYTDVYKNEYIDSRLEFMSATATSLEINKFSTDVGDVIVTKDSESPSDIAIPACISEKIDGLLCGYHLTQIKPVDLDGRYLLRLFQSKGFNAQFIISANGVTRFGLPQYAISNAYSCMPPRSEQKEIAAFLDFKTAQIDALISKQKALLDKLAEKRTALISHAVTKGLDPSVTMKDSGVAWLGEIPEHWETTRIKFIARVGNGSTPSRDKAEYWDENYFPWLNSSVVNQDEVISTEQYVSALALKECHLPIVNPPAILVGITGQGKTRGMATKLNIKATINQHVVYIKPYSNDVQIDYVLFLFEQAYVLLRSQSDSGGSTKGAITCEQIKNLCIPLPPANEQIAIKEYISGELDVLVKMRNKIELIIEKLTEYRLSIISEAVTGKIDVRDFQCS